MGYNAVAHIIDLSSFV